MSQFLNDNLNKLKLFISLCTSDRPLHKIRPIESNNFFSNSLTSRE